MEQHKVEQHTKRDLGTLDDNNHEYKQSNQKNTASSKKSRFHFLWCEYWPLFVLTLLSVLIRGYTYRGTFMLPFSYHYLDPTLFSRDIAFFPYDLNFFFLVNAHLSKLISYETMFFVGYVVSSFLLILGVYLISVTLFKDKKVGYLAVILTIFVKPAISAMTTVWTYYYYKDLAMGLILISFALFLRKRYISSFSLLGVASLLHILFSLYFVAFYGLYFLVTWVWSSRAVTGALRKKMMIGFVILGLFLAGPMYLILSSEQPVTSAAHFQAWLTILKTRSFDHFFPSTWITNSVVVFLPLFLLFLIFMMGRRDGGWTEKNCTLRDKNGVGTRTSPFPLVTEFRFEMLLFFLVVVFFGFCAVVFSELIPVRMLIIAQLFRPTILLTFFALVFSAYLIITWFNQFRWEQDNVERNNTTIFTGQKYAGQRWLPLGIDFVVVGGVLFIALFKYDFRLLLLILPNVMVILSKDLVVQKLGERTFFIVRYVISRVTIGFFVLCVLSFFFPHFLYVPYVQEQVFLLQPLSYILLLVLFFFLACYAVLIRREGKLRKMVGIFAGSFVVLALLLGGVLAVHESTVQSDDPCYTATNSFDFREHFQYPTFPITEHMKMALWARDSTDKNALFMIPPECGSDFRNFGERSVFMDFKYGTMTTFSVDFGLEWWRRVKAINPWRTDYNYHTFYANLISDYGTMNESLVHSIDSTYHLDYAVFKVGVNQKMDFPVVYNNSEYVVYDVRGDAIIENAKTSDS